MLSFKRAELRNKLKRRSLQVLGELREPEISKMALPSITAGKTKYSFVKPLIVRVKKHESGYYIENNQLGLISSGNTIQMAMRNFSDEFTYIYKRYNELPVEQLTGRVQKIKFLVNSLVHGSSR